MLSYSPGHANSGYGSITVPRGGRPISDSRTRVARFLGNVLFVGHLAAASLGSLRVHRWHRNQRRAGRHLYRYRWSRGRGHSNRCRLTLLLNYRGSLCVTGSVWFDRDESDHIRENHHASEVSRADDGRASAGQLQPERRTCQGVLRDLPIHRVGLGSISR
jgi:hypothetical protein